MNIEATLQEVLERLKAAEDQLALYQFVLSNGPAGDGRVGGSVRPMWTDDAIRDADMFGPLHVADMPASAGSGALVQSMRAAGAAHVVSAPVVRVDGDRALGLAYHQIVVKDDGHRIWRMTAGRWDWVRQADGWKLRRLTLRVFDGSSDAPELMGETLLQIQSSSPLPKVEGPWKAASPGVRLTYDSHYSEYR